MTAGCENWPITVTLLAASGKDECLEQKLGRNDRVSPTHAKKSPGLGQSSRLPDRSPSQLRKSKGDCCVPTECGDDFQWQEYDF
jgi:hypothetical protein